MSAPAKPESELRMYGALAPWWTLVSRPADYAPEAESLLKVLDLPASGLPRTLLELGSGGGNLASHLKAHFHTTLSDLSPAMLAVSRALNPECEHVAGDMRTLRLGRAFDVVLIHDAIMYLVDAAEVREALATAAAHCRSGGSLVLVPDAVRETFEPTTRSGGHDGADGRGVRYLAWVSDPDPSDASFETLYAFVLREADGATRVELDRHVEGLFACEQWLAWLRESGFEPRFTVDAWSRHVFVGVRR